MRAQLSPSKEPRRRTSNVKLFSFAGLTSASRAFTHETVDSSAIGHRSESVSRLEQSASVNSNGRRTSESPGSVSCVCGQTLRLMRTSVAFAIPVQVNVPHRGRRRTQQFSEHYRIALEGKTRRDGLELVADVLL